MGGINMMTIAQMIAGCGFALIAGGMNPVAVAQELNDYPTAARVDYVFACMKANGDTRDALERCSCSIDVVATLLTYEQYVAAETVMSLAQIPGERGAQFRSTEQSQAAIDHLRRAQAEAEVRCF
jgi:hypothetical protein